MKVLQSIAEVRSVRRQFSNLALVPTMGALHAGHVSLVALAKQHAEQVAVSIFVNPTQFGPAEDFSRYPRPIEQDLEMCRQAGVDLIFHPGVEEMYPPGSPAISIDLPGLTNVLEGEHRPGHFAGVCQVVGKLFNILQPDAAVFGRKDYQQLCVLRAMVEAMNWPVQVIAAPTIREPDGLAMSSRNRYLSPAERQRALAINRSLTLARDEVAQGRRATAEIIAQMQHLLLEAQLVIDYIAAVDPRTLAPVAEASSPTLFAIAAKAGSTRLIDNLLVGE